jgi:hypothetical protein
MLFIEDDFFVSFFLNLHDGLGVDVQKEVVRDELRVSLHLEARPICCIRGLKSSLVIGPKAQISPISFTPRGRANLVVCFFKLKNVCYDTAQALLNWVHPKWRANFIFH